MLPSRSLPYPKIALLAKIIALRASASSYYPPLFHMPGFTLDKALAYSAEPFL
ncbi:unnamed protein product [Periconia digitata]|uniref:Uncharacterized protein n=1 Tax=Periconia digitata TaxID=1303443 RepID=A0A9W4UMC0_9PLEO|nr:unnamed protein product [Periconia digitata]